MAMRRTTIRFGEQAWRLLEVEAVEDGVSVAQYVREAAIGRVVWARAHRGVELSQAMLDVFDQIRNEDRGETARTRDVIHSITENAPDRLNALLSRLDETDPTAASIIRDWYDIPPGGFLAEI